VKETFCRVASFLVLASAARAAPDESNAIDYETARFERRLIAKRATGPIEVDGDLGEPGWRSAPVATDFIQNEPREGEAATYDTEVRFLYDEVNLYFGVLAHDAEPAKIIVNDLTRDFNTRSGDIFGLVLDTFHDERNGFMFETNPAGAKFDAQFVNEGREFNQNWDGVWYVKSQVTDAGWVTEMAIPLKTVRFQHLERQTWGVNFVRRTRRLNEDSYWAPLPRIHRFTRLSLAGTLEDLEGLEPHRDVKVTPYGKADVNDAADLSTESDFDAGIDAKIGIGAGLRLDLTLNTDFSEVEADVQQINLTRFSLFFPEKRDFFLENSGIFRFGPPQDQRVQQFQASFGAAGAISNLRGGQSRGEDLLFFFSRRVGLSDDGQPHSFSVYGPKNEPISTLTRPVASGDRVAIPEFGVEFEVLDIPGHTRAHIAYYGSKMVFCGDTLFACGCGRGFEGTPPQLHASLAKLAALPEDTLVYCGHEYTLANIRFARAVEPGNVALAGRERTDTTTREKNHPTLPTTIGLEKATNPFLRCAQPEVAQAAARRRGTDVTDPVEVFTAIREWKNTF